MRPGDPFSPVALGTPRVHLRETDSTNDRARALAAGGAPHGTLVTAAAQTAGRGRQGRTWSAPPGSALLMSLVLRDPPPLLPLIAAVAVCDAVGAHTRGAAGVKWPNDIVIPRDVSGADEASSGAGPGASPGLAKLAGILTEARMQEGWAVLGIGLNVSVRLEELPPDVAAAASLELDRAQIEPVLGDVLAALERRLRTASEEVLSAWRERDALRGREVRWAAGHGRAEGIDGSGRLIVTLPDGGQTTLGAGEVHLDSSGAASRSH